MKIAAPTIALVVAVLASSASAQKSSRDDFQEFCKVLQGRWIGDVKLVADRPGFGKKGEKLTAYAECSITEDGNAMLARYFAGEGSGTWLICFDAAAKQIKSLWVTSGGIVNQSTIRKQDDKWVERMTGSDPDGTKTKLVSTLTITDNGNTHTFYGYDGRVVCWEENFEKKRFDLALSKHQVYCLAFSPDSKTLATGGRDGMVKWIDVEQGKVVKSFEVTRHAGKGSGSIACLTFSADGRLLGAGVGSSRIGAKWGETFLIDVPKAEVYKVPSSQEDHVITCVAFSLDSKYLAAGGMEGVLKLWHTDGEEKGDKKDTGAE